MVVVAFVIRQAINIPSGLFKVCSAPRDLETLLSALQFVRLNARIKMEDLITTVACTFSQMHVPKVSHSTM